MEASAIQKSMEKAMSICRKESEDEQTKIERKRKKVDWFDLLTDDILLDILKRLPDVFLGYKAKYVCRRWLNIIRTGNLLVCASFILQKAKNFTARYVGVREEGEGLQFKVQDLDIPHIGMIRSWANEFLLISHDKERKQSLYVYNLITKEGSYLPECNASCGGYCSIKCGVAISFDGLEQIYKVVHLFMGPPIECHILILRKNIVSSKWKKIKTPWIDDGRLYSSSAVSIQGRYFHWDDFGSERLVSIDMVKEEIVDISLPLRGDDWVFEYTIFEMGGYLALCGGDDFNKFDIWILKDFQRKEWEKLQSVTLKRLRHKRFPVCGVMSNKYIILECKYDRGMCYYDLENGVEKKLDIYIDWDDGCTVHSSPPGFK